jgi:hypothetical protein
MSTTLAAPPQTSPAVPSTVRDGTAARDGGGRSSRSSSSGASPSVAPSRMLDLVRSIEQPFTVGTLVRAAERDGVSISQALRWLRDAQETSVSATGERRASKNALRGARLYELRG